MPDRLRECAERTQWRMVEHARKTNPIEANEKPHFQIGNAEIRAVEHARRCKTNPMAHGGAPGRLRLVQRLWL
jgi:hypothetical protein